MKEIIKSFDSLDSLLVKEIGNTEANLRKSKTCGLAEPILRSVTSKAIQRLRVLYASRSALSTAKLNLELMSITDEP
jgi:hypothetical protein